MVKMKVEKGMRHKNSVLFTYYSVHCSTQSTVLRSAMQCSVAQYSEDTRCRHLEQNGTEKGGKGTGRRG